MFASGYVNTASTTFVIYFIKEIQNTAYLHSLMQTREGVWENSKVYVNLSCRRGFTQRLSSSPKLPRVFASGYVNMEHVLYFLNVIYASTREKFKYFLLSVDKQMSPVPLKRNTVPVLCACACTYAFACIIHVNQLLI